MHGKGGDNDELEDDSEARAIMERSIFTTLDLYAKSFPSSIIQSVQTLSIEP